MRRIATSSLRPGMELAKKVTHGDGAPLLNAGVKLQPKYIQQLKKLNISAVYVHDNLIPDVAIEDVVLEETRERAIKQVRIALTELNQAEDKSSIKKMLMFKKELSLVLDDIVSQLLANPNLTVNLSDIRSADNYTFSHSVVYANPISPKVDGLACLNVAEYNVLVGKTTGKGKTSPLLCLPC